MRYNAGMRLDHHLYQSLKLVIHRIVMTILTVWLCSGAVFAQNGDDMSQLFNQLSDMSDEGWRIAEADILREWSKSGSPALDVLLQRGEEALDRGDAVLAIGHLTALTDRAPDFATGWQTRAVAFAASGHYGPALDDLARALALEPRQFAALTQLGAILEELGEDARALAAYRESLKIHPHQQEAIDGAARLERRHSGTDI